MRPLGADRRHAKERHVCAAHHVPRRVVYVIHRPAAVDRLHPPPQSIIWLRERRATIDAVQVALRVVRVGVHPVRRHVALQAVRISSAVDLVGGDIESQIAVATHRPSRHASHISVLTVRAVLSVTEAEVVGPRSRGHGGREPVHVIVGVRRRVTVGAGIVLIPVAVHVSGADMLLFGASTLRCKGAHTSRHRASRRMIP